MSLYCLTYNIDHEIGDKLEHSTQSATTMCQAAAWIKHCQDNHQSRKPGRKDWWPTRLLDCGLAINPSQEQIRIVESDSNINPLRSLYVTLSHCWGDKDHLKLTTRNYAEFLQGVALSRLPRLYQDTIYVARYLGIRYIWIESLCIIQKETIQRTVTTK